VKVTTAMKTKLNVNTALLSSFSLYTEIADAMESNGMKDVGYKYINL
jgi:hypothetical protein